MQEPRRVGVSLPHPSPRRGPRRHVRHGYRVGGSGVSTFIASQHSAAPVEALASGAIRPGRARIRTILLATDLSPISDAAAAEAIDLCGALGARLLIVNVIDSRQGFGKQLRPVARASRLDQIRADRERSLLDVVGAARALGIDASFLVWT